MFFFIHQVVYRRYMYIYCICIYTHICNHIYTCMYIYTDTLLQSSSRCWCLPYETFERIGPCQWCFGVSTEVVSRNRRCQGTLAVMSCTTSSIWALLKRWGQIWKEYKEIPPEYRRLETVFRRPQKRCWNNLGKKTKTMLLGGEQVVLIRMRGLCTTAVCHTVALGRSRFEDGKVSTVLEPWCD